MAAIEDKLHAMGLTLPGPIKPPLSVVLPFDFVRIIGDRATISGHGPQNLDGSLAEPLGKVGRPLCQPSCRPHIETMSLTGDDIGNETEIHRGLPGTGA